MMHVFSKSGKQRGTVVNTESDKLASTGLTEKQLQLSVEVWKNNAACNTGE